MAQTIGFGDIVDPSQNQNQQNGQQGSNGQSQNSSQNQAPAAGQQGTAQAGASNAGQGPSGTGSGGQGSQNLGQYKPQNYSQQNQGTGFVNLQSYLNANNPSQLQNAVVQNIGQQNQATQAGLQGQQSTFQQGMQANQANTMANQGLVQNVLANPTGYTATNGSNTAGVGQSGVNAPTPPGTANPAAPNLAQGTQFSNLINGQYQGPTGLANTSQLQGQGTAAAQTASNLGSAAGRTSILQQLMANPNYTQGMAGLDTALLGQGNQAALNTAANQSRGMNSQINQAIAGASAQGAEAQSNAQQFGQQTQGQLGSALQNTQAGLTNQAAQAQNASNSQFAQLQSALASGSLTPQQAQMMGLTQGENLYGVNAANFITQNPQQATAQNVATPQQYAQMQALRQLAGSGANSQAQQVFQNFANPAQASSFTNTPTTNAAGLQSAITAAGQNYNTQLQPAQAAEQQAQQIENDWSNTSLGNLGQRNADVAALTGGGATGGSIEQNMTWAQNNLASQQAALAAAQANVNAAYGPNGNQTVNIVPQQAGGQAIGPQLQQFLGNQTIPQQVSS